MNTKSEQQFQGIAGMGTLLFKRAFPHDVNLWSGPMTLIDGRKVIIEALGNKTAGYTVKVKLPHQDSAKWELLDEFHMDGFSGSSRTVRCESKVTGKFVAYPATTRSKEPCVRLHCQTSAAAAF
jgi:hypothetical protein